MTMRIEVSFLATTSCPTRTQSGLVNIRLLDCVCCRCGERTHCVDFAQRRLPDVGAVRAKPTEHLPILAGPDRHAPRTRETQREWKVPKLRPFVVRKEARRAFARGFQRAHAVSAVDPL